MSKASGKRAAEGAERLPNNTSGGGTAATESLDRKLQQLGPQYDNDSNPARTGDQVFPPDRKRQRLASGLQQFLSNSGDGRAMDDALRDAVGSFDPAMDFRFGNLPLPSMGLEAPTFRNPRPRVNDDNATVTGNENGNDTVTDTLLINTEALGTTNKTIPGLSKYIMPDMPSFLLVSQDDAAAPFLNEHLAICKALPMINLSWYTTKESGPNERPPIRSASELPEYGLRGTTLHFTLMPQSSGAAVMETSAIEGKAYMLAIWICCSKTLTSLSHLWILVRRVTEGCEDEEFVAAENNVSGKYQMILANNRPKNSKPLRRYWRMQPYVCNNARGPPPYLYNGPGWKGRKIYFGRVAGSWPVIEDPARFKSTVDAIVNLRPGGFTNCTAAIMRLGENLPLIPVAVRA